MQTKRRNEKKVRFGEEYNENKTVCLYHHIFSPNPHLLTAVCSCGSSLTVSSVQWEGSAWISDKQILAESQNHQGWKTLFRSSSPTINHPVQWSY